MKTRRNANATIWTAVLAATLLPALAGAQGISLSVGNTVPVTNVLGRTLPGTDGDPGHACQVEIRETWTGGFILPPTDENLETFNPTITNSYLGCGVVGENSGTYSEGFNDRSVFRTNQLYYVRVFNLPLTYYADTPAFFGPPDDVSSINPEFGPLQRVDGEEDVDSDGDGIPDMLEDSELSTSPSEPDTDGDTYGDWFEAYYSDYMDPLSDPRTRKRPSNSTFNPRRSRPIRTSCRGGPCRCRA